jgi:cytidyltransferase-like protein
MFNPTKPTALFLGRYQPFHKGHATLIAKGIERLGQALVAVRSTFGTDEKNPFSEDQVLKNIRQGMKEAGFEEEVHYRLIVLPNITTIMYGREVGYSIEQIVLPSEIEAISATKLRAQGAARE